MKKKPLCQKIILLALIVLSAFSSQAQQQFTQTVTAQNKYCNNGCSFMDIPGLNNNPLAIIMATPVLVNGVNLNPHNIGAYYVSYLQKWSIYNLNGTNMTVGAQFNVEYYVNRDANHFVFVVPQPVHSTDNVYIDHAGLNNNPNAQIRVFPTTSPNGALYNISEVRVVYEAAASKWLIANNNNATVPSGVAYNVVFSNGGPGFINPNADKNINPNTLPPVSASANCNCVIPTSLPPNGSAGGDLGGAYPYPRVTGLQGKPLSSDPPAVGQVLKWNGSAWEPANENTTSGNTYNAGTGLAIQGSTIYANNIAPMWNANKLSGNSVSNTTPTIGQVLKWNGTAWEPAANNAGTATPVQTFYKNTYEESPFLDNSSSYVFAGHTYTVTVTTNSRLVISGNFGMMALPCIACTPTKLGLDLMVNNTFKISLSNQDIASNGYNTISVSNYMFDVTPGTYIIAFKATHGWIDGNTAGRVSAIFSSIMVLQR